MKPIVIIPTYNERENIKELISLIRECAKEHDLHILVVDSASPDRTADEVIQLQKTDSKIFIFNQTTKLGLGMAYQDGMKWALDRGYDRIVTMDADFSHHPQYLNQFLKESETVGLVVGSRYAPGGELRNWPWTRRILSRFANWYAKRITGLPFTDLTSGFHCFHGDLLKQILHDPLRADGYAFLIALKFLAIVNGATYIEIPIIFSDRTKGDTKISKWVIFESIFFVWKCYFQRHRINILSDPLKRPKEEMFATKNATHL